MGIHHPRHPGDGTHDPPRTLLEFLVTLEHDPARTPAEMLATVEAAVERLGELLHDQSFADLPLRNVFVEGFYPAQAPLYPLRAGDETFHERVDVHALAERILHPTALGARIFDHAGRAFEAHVQVTWARREDWDRPAGTEPPA